MFDGLRKIEEQFDKIADLDITKKTIVLSDGQVNEGTTQLGAFAEKSYEFFHKKNINISTIGFGTDYNLELMSMLANKGEGKFFHLKESEDIYSIIEEELETINSIVARNAKLTITIPNGFTFDENLNNFNEEYVDNKIEIKLGNLYSSKYMIFPIALLRKIRNKKVSIPIELSYIDNEENSIEISTSAVLLISRDPEEKGEENQELIKEVADTLNRKAILNATVEFENTGSYSSATTMMSNSITNLSASYSSAKSFAASYQSDFESTIQNSVHDINELRELNSRAMYDIKNKK